MPKKPSGWLRTFDIIVGVIAIFLSLVVLLNPELTIATLIFILSITLIIIGIARILNGFLGEKLSDGLRAVNIFVGLLSFVLAFFVLIYIQLTTIVLIYLLSFILLLNGIARIVIGGAIDEFPGWLRGFLIVVGAMSIGLSFLIFLVPRLGAATIIIYLSLVLIINGITRIVRGATGRKIKSI